MKSLKFRVYNKNAKSFIKDEGGNIRIFDLWSWSRYITAWGIEVETYHYIFQQFTGIENYGGQKIYDGDLIMGDDYGPYRVFWDEQIGGWCSCCYSDAELIYSYCKIEVVGHIFDGTKYEGVQ